MIYWLQPAFALLGALISGAVGGAILYDRWLRHRNRITGEIDIEVLPGTIERPAEHPWEPPIVEPGATDGIVVRATIHNNTSAPIIVQKWEVIGPPLESEPHVHYEEVMAGETGVATTMFVPDWEAWDQRLEAGLTERAAPVVRVSLITLSRETSMRLRLRSAKYNVSDVTIRQNVEKSVNSSNTT